MADIGKKIRARREELGLTQEELATKLGYKSKTTIAKIENGTNDIVQSKVIDFANALSTSISYLMGWSEEPTKETSSKGYYIDEETAKTAQEIYNNDKVLFDVYNTVDKERLVDFAKKLAELRKIEGGDE